MKKYQYESLAEKDAYFARRITISSVEELLKELETHGSKHYAFRGQSNALWSIRSSALRWWQDQRCQKCFKIASYIDFVSEALAYSQKDEYPSLQVECPLHIKNAWFGDHERLGFLQHYSYPTPFVDFTYDPWVAMFMALKGQRHNDFFSIYAINCEQSYSNEVVSLERLVEDNAFSESERMAMLTYGKCGENISSAWCDASFLVIHKDGSLWCPHLAEERIASQSGLFIYTSKQDSIEGCAVEYKLWDKSAKRPSETSALNIEPLVCFDVPDKFSDVLWQMCSLHNYTNDSLGFANLSRDAIAQECFHSFVRGCAH